MRNRQVVAIICATLALAADLRGQGGAPAQRRILRPGTEVAVDTGRAVILGRVLTTTGSTVLLLDTDRGLDSLPLNAIVRWRWRDTHARAGALWGAGIGGVTAGLLGALIGSAICEGSNCGAAGMTGGAFGAAVGVLGGGGAGALLGSFLPNWIEEEDRGIAVQNGARAALPVSLHVGGGLTSADGGTVQEGGVAFVMAGTRVGLEAGHNRLKETFASTYQGPSDFRLQSYSRLAIQSGYAGLAFERQAMGDLSMVGSLSRQWHTETQQLDGLGDVTAANYPVHTIAVSTHHAAGLGGSAGLVLRHRVLGEFWLRIDARQHFGAFAMRTLTTGLEL